MLFMMFMLRVTYLNLDYFAQNLLHSLLYRAIKYLFGLTIQIELRVLIIPVRQYT